MTSINISAKKRIAVFFGGRSPEHDVSIVTGLQVLAALDQSRYEVFPVYVTTDGVWLTGDVLRHKGNYMLDANNRAACREVFLDVTTGRGGRLMPKKTGLFGGKEIEFDVAIPAFHGLYGEDGNMQGVFETVGAAYAGMRTMASAILMDKAVTKMAMVGLGIPVLPWAVLTRPAEGFFIPADVIEATLRASRISFPCILKPSHLGSSIGVAKVNNAEEISACLPAIFEYDGVAIVEPFVPNLVEYNVAVSKVFGETRTSAIERPKTTQELLDFKEKYLSNAGKGGKKTGTSGSEGMLSLTRDINPAMDARMEHNIRDWAMRMFAGLRGTGAPRIDFIGNSKSGEIWLNEVNPCPGSFGYFLWEAAAAPVLFSEFLTAMVEEALLERRKTILPKDPVPMAARLHRRPG
ncbi:MAG: D-alanine--D-alanine ligase [Alphaproteobacteria bacterium]